MGVPETGAGFCGGDRVFHRLRRQRTPFSASEYVHHRAGTMIPAMAASRSCNRVGWHMASLRFCQISPSMFPMSLLHLEKYLLHFRPCCPFSFEHTTRTGSKLYLSSVLSLSLGQGINKASISARGRLTPHLDKTQIYFFLFSLLIAPLVAPKRWKQEGSDSSPRPRDLKRSYHNE